MMMYGSSLSLLSLGFRVWGLGFGVWGLGFGVWGLGFVVHEEAVANGIQLCVPHECDVPDLRFRV